MHIEYSADCAIWAALKFLDGYVRHPSGITFSLATISELFINGYFKTSRPTALCIDASVPVPLPAAVGGLTGDLVPLASLETNNSSSSASSVSCASLSPPTLKRSAADSEIANVKRTADLKGVFSESSDDDSDPSAPTTAVKSDDDDGGGGGGDSAAGSR